MAFVRLAGHVLKSAALWACLAAVVLCLVLAALGFLTAALFIWVASHLGAAAAAAVTALALLVIAVQIALAGGVALSRLRARAPGLFDDTAGTIAMVTTMISLLVRRDPRRSILVALLAGALTEYLAGGEGGRG
jgi:autotransporter translocation and assembly factor TamB